MRRTTALLGLTCVLLGAAPFPAGAASRPPSLLRIDLTNHFGVRPAVVHFGADSGVFVTGLSVTKAQFRAGHYGHIHWVAWNRSVAKGAGTVWVERCVPNCAAGGFNRHPSGALQASRVRHGHYTRLLLAYRAGNQAIYERYVLKFAGGVNGWNLVAVIRRQL